MLDKNSFICYNDYSKTKEEHKMKDMFTIQMAAWHRYSNYWNRMNRNCMAALDAGDMETAEHYLRLMQIANTLGERKFN